MPNPHRARVVAASAALVAASILAVACEPPADAATPPDRDPDLRGTVSAVQLSDTVGEWLTMGVRLSGTMETQGGPTEVDARITDRSRVLHRAAGIGRPDDLQVGQEVSVWFDGPLAESFPLQGTVDAIVIESRGG